MLRRKTLKCTKVSIVGKVYLKFLECEKIRGEITATCWNSSPAFIRWKFELLCVSPRSIQQFSCTYGFIQIQSNIICRTGNGAGAWWELLVLLSRLFGHQLFPSKCSRLYGLDLNSAVTCTDCFPCMFLWVILTFKFLLFHWDHAQISIYGYLSWNMKHFILTRILPLGKRQTAGGHAADVV